MRPLTVGSVPDGVNAVDDLGGIAAAASHVVLDGADLATAVGDRIGLAALELIDRARRLGAGLGDDERDAALDGELAYLNKLGA